MKLYVYRYLLKPMLHYTSVHAFCGGALGEVLCTSRAIEGRTTTRKSNLNLFFPKEKKR